MDSIAAKNEQNMTWLPDGPGYSADYGYKFWKCGNSIFWEHGEITFANDEGNIFQAYPRTDVENYSLWSEEKRTAVKADVRARCLARREFRRVELDRQNQLRETARAKLTPEEFAATANLYATEPWEYFN